MALAREQMFDSEKFVFAVDLVFHVLEEEWPLPERRSRDIGDYYRKRELVYPAFSEIVQRATDRLRQNLYQSVANDFETMRANNTLDRDAYLTYVNTYAENNFYQGEFNARSLLKFSVSIALLAGHLLNHREVNIQDLPELACNMIIMRFPTEDMNYEIRTKLDEAAESYVRN